MGRIEGRWICCKLLEHTPPRPSLSACLAVNRFKPTSVLCSVLFTLTERLPCTQPGTDPWAGQGHVLEGFHLCSRSPASSRPLGPRLKRAAAACQERKDPEGTREHIPPAKLAGKVMRIKAEASTELIILMFSDLPAWTAGVTSLSKPHDNKQALRK